MADLEDVDEMKADGPARRVGRSAEAGFARAEVSKERHLAINRHGEANLEAPGTPSTV